MCFNIEIIPDEDFVFCRVHLANYSTTNEKPEPRAFSNTPSHLSNLSCDWEKYANEHQCKNRVLIYNKDPEKYKVVKLSVSLIRNIRSDIKVLHDPICTEQEQNQAHSIIENKENINKDVEYRLRMVEIAEVVL